jgi:hypothetical protein
MAVTRTHFTFCIDIWTPDRETSGPGLGDNFDPRHPTHRSGRHPTGLHDTAGDRLTF